MALRYLPKERLLLRLGLYAILATCTLQFIGVRFLMEMSGTAGRPSRTFQQAYFPEIGFSSMTIRLVAWLVNRVGISDELCLLLIAVSLAGLAASARSDTPVLTPTIAMDEPGPIPAPKPIPQRHPLDPDPDDPPPRSPWNRTSPPST